MPVQSRLEPLCNGQHGLLGISQVSLYTRFGFDHCMCMLHVCVCVCACASASCPSIRCELRLRKSFAPYRGRNPQNREKRVSESKNPRFPPRQKRVFRVKRSHFPCRALYRNGDFLTRNTLCWGGGKWGFFDSETLFS